MIRMPAASSSASPTRPAGSISCARRWKASPSPSPTRAIASSGRGDRRGRPDRRRLRAALWTRIIAAAIERPVIRYRDGEAGPAFGAARLARLAKTGEAAEDLQAAGRRRRRRARSRSGRCVRRASNVSEAFIARSNPSLPHCVEKPPGRRQCACSSKERARRRSSGRRLLSMLVCSPRPDRRDPRRLNNHR